MAYINKRLSQLVIAMDKAFTVDSGVRKWVTKQIIPKHNLIIKKKDVYHCTNCHKEWYSQAQVYDKVFCPKCKQELMVRIYTLQYHIFLDDFRILDFIDGYFVLRGFEVRSEYNNYKVKHHIQEYQRLVISKDKLYLFLSNTYKLFLTSQSVNHYEKHTRWRLYDNYYSSWYYSRGPIYWGSIDGDTEGTEYQYCPIVRVLSEYKTDNIEGLLQRVLVNPVAFELLSKLNLTNLAIMCHTFNSSGSFENRFGVPKDYLPFMVKHNVTYHELEVLRLIKRKNIRLIRKFTEYQCFDELTQYIDVVKALDYGLNLGTEHIYRDYLQMAEQLKLNMKDKKVLYPKDIMEEHDKLLKQVKDIESKEIVAKIKIRYEELKNNTYSNDKFIVYPISSLSHLLAESHMQNNCVRTYNKRYADGEVDLYVMRLVKKLDKSLVTIEVKDNKVVQSKTKNNNNCTKEQLAFINEWQAKVLKGSETYATT